MGKKKVKQKETAREDKEYQKAVEFTLTREEVQISALQRHLRIGYSEASTLLDRMEK